MLTAIRSILCLCLALITTVLLQAQTSATSELGSTVSTTSIANGSSWTNPLNVQNNNDVYATALITGSNKPTHYIDAKNWGFQSTTSGQANYIPPTAIINGIEVFIKVRKTGVGSIRDNRIILLKNGAENGTEKAKTSLWPTTGTYATYGASTDLWGATWAVSDILNSAFGVRISARNKGNKDAQAEIDHIRIIVHFNQTYFYSKSSGNLDLTSTWGSSTDGSGVAPSNFSGNGQIFFLRNRSAATLTNDLTISGTGAKFVIGDGTNATTLTVPSGFVLNAATDIAAQSSLVISNTIGPTIRAVADNTTITYNANGDQALAEINYYNLTIGGSGIKNITTNSSGVSLVTNVLTIQSGATLNNQGNNILITGSANALVNNGTASGEGKYIYSLVDVSTTISGAGTYNNLEIDAASTGGTSVITLSNPTTITGTLTLTDGQFSNFGNLTMATNSKLVIGNGSIGTALTGSSYDVTYSTFTGSSKTTGHELAGSVRDVLVQVAGGTTLNLGSNLNIARNLTISSGTLDPTAANYSLTIGANLTNSATITSRNNLVSFNGGSTTTISGSGTQSFFDLTINKSSNGVQLSVPVNVQGTVTLTNGILTTTTSNILSLGASASIAGGSASSYVDGPMNYTLAATSGTRTFSIGKSGAYRPVTLSLTQNNNTATTYTAEVFSGAPPSRTLPSDLTNVSSVRYYTVNTSNNTNLSSATISLNYGVDDNVADHNYLRIAKSSGTNWMNIGGTGSASGTGIITSSAFNSFSDFVLADAPMILPLTWVSIYARKVSTGVELSWQTANEVNTKDFTIEKSRDGNLWTTIGTISSANSTNNNYKFTDAHPDVINYYRIKQTDIDGRFSYSKAIVHHQAGASVFKIIPNPAVGGSFRIEADQHILQAKKVTVQIFTISGNKVLEENFSGAAFLKITYGKLVPGLYTVRIHTEDRIKQTSFIVK